MSAVIIHVEGTAKTVAIFTKRKERWVRYENDHNLIGVKDGSVVIGNRIANDVSDEEYAEANGYKLEVRE